MEHESEADTEWELEPLREQVEAALRHPLDEQWDEVLEQWSGAAPSERKAVRSYVSGLRNRLLDALLEIEALDEFKRGVAIQYVEVKCHWTMLNTQIQYQTAREGRPDEALIYRATCVSLILQALEPFLSREHVADLADFLVEPIR